MKKASAYTYLAKPKQRAQMMNRDQQQEEIDLNSFVITFDEMKVGQKNITEGEPYTCQKCHSILNKFSKLLNSEQYKQTEWGKTFELKNNQSLWQCQFCHHPNVLKIEKQEIPTKKEVFYLIESQLQNIMGDNEETMIFCLDTSGSMNTTTQIAGKMDLKYGLSSQEIQMLKQFMDPGDQAQFNYLPGFNNQNKTFISRKQCILSAVESQLQEIKKNNPNRTIGFVTFNNQVNVNGDKNVVSVNLVGDKLKDRNGIIQSLNNFQLTETLGSSMDHLLNQLNKQEAKGQTALGPALLSAIQVASKGKPGSTVFLCTDGLANVGIGALEEPLSQESVKFYDDLANFTKERNISVNIMTIKGQGCKMQVIGKLAEKTNGNMKIVNPEKLTEDFANILKDQIVGLNMNVVVQLHRALQFRKEEKQFLHENNTLFKKNYVNATTNTKISFQYEVRCEEDLKEMKIDVENLKKIPFQTQIMYTNGKGAKYLRVISSEAEGTTNKQLQPTIANIPVAQIRSEKVSAKLFSKGAGQQSLKHKQKWGEYMNNNFSNSSKYGGQQQMYSQKNVQVQKVIEKKVEHHRMIEEEQKPLMMITELDEAQVKIKNLEMEKQDYDLDMDCFD